MSKDRITKIGREFKQPLQIPPGQVVDGKEIVERIGRRLARLLMQEARQAGIYGLSDDAFVQVLLGAAAAPVACVLKTHIMGIEKASLDDAVEVGTVMVRALLTQFPNIEDYAKTES